MSEQHREHQREVVRSLVAALLVILFLYGLWHLPEIQEWIYPTHYPAPNVE